MTIQVPEKQSGKRDCERAPYSLELFEDDGFGNRVFKSMPSPSELDDYYAKNFARQSYERFGKKLEAFRRAWLSRSLLSKSQKLRPAVLEVGSGNGQFLAAYRRLSAGAALSAVEYENSDLERVSALCRINIFSSDQELEARGSSFDLIALWHVVEHLIDPWIRLKQLARLLKPNGVLVFSTPNMFCPGVLRSPSTWPWNQWPPIHLWHFHPEALQKRLRSEWPGFGIRVFTRESRDANFLFDSFIRPIFLDQFPLKLGTNLRVQSLIRIILAGFNESILNPLLQHKGYFGSEIVAVLKKGEPGSR